MLQLIQIIFSYSNGCLTVAFISMFKGNLHVEYMYVYGKRVKIDPNQLTNQPLIRLAIAHWRSEKDSCQILFCFSLLHTYDLIIKSFSFFRSLSLSRSLVPFPHSDIPSETQCDHVDYVKYFCKLSDGIFINSYSFNRMLCFFSTSRWKCSAGKKNWESVQNETK